MDWFFTAQAAAGEGALEYLSRFGTQGLLIAFGIYYLPYLERREKERREERQDVRAAFAKILASHAEQLDRMHQESVEIRRVLTAAIEAIQKMKDESHPKEE